MKIFFKLKICHVSCSHLLRLTCVISWELHSNTSKDEIGSPLRYCVKGVQVILHVCDNLCDPLTNTKITYLLWLIMRLDYTLSRRRSENTIICGNDDNIHVTKLTEKVTKYGDQLKFFE